MSTSYQAKAHHMGSRHSHHHHSDDEGFFAFSAAFFAVLFSLEYKQHHYKLAVVDAGPAALDVLNGQPSSDMFVSGKEAAEAVLKTTFTDDTDAAIAILELGEALQHIVPDLEEPPSGSPRR
ncbi:MAG: hypothetical protein AAB116_09145 [Candidatus Poribacteria bacterium]